MASQNMLVTFQLLFHSRKILAFPLQTKNNLIRMMHFHQQQQKKKKKKRTSLPGVRTPSDVLLKMLAGP